MNYKSLIKLHNHKISYCKMCGPMIICGFCGNNCCNGSSGKIVNGKTVPCSNNCKEAYLIQTYLEENNKWPIFYKIRFSIKMINLYIRRIRNKIIKRFYK